MRYKSKALICFVLIISLIFSISLPGQLSVPASDDLQINNEDFIKADGKVLKKKSGEEVILKGTNAGGYLLQEMWMTLTKQTENVQCQKQIIEKLKERFPEDYQTLLDLYEEKYWSESDFDNCKELGMNVLRLPFWHMNFLDNNGNIKDNTFERIDWFVNEAGKRGMYVILDMHGVPGSQNGKDHSGDTTQGVSFFQGSDAEANQQAVINIWKKIAEHYKGNPVVAGYDLLNEPYTSETIQLTTRTVWDYYDKAYRAIRENDDEHLIIMEATWEPQRLPNPTEYGWTNVMYEYHCYNYDSQTDADAQLSSINKKLKNIDKADYNVPSYIGETSFFSNMDSWRACLQRLNDYGISWTTWTYKTTYKNSSWGIFNQTTAEADIENDSYYTIYSKWSKAGECSKNEELYNLLKEYYKQKVSIEPSGEGRYEAELADAFPNGGDIKTMTTNFGKFSNDGYVEAMNGNNSTDMNSGKHALFHVKVDKTGTYRLMVGYATTTDTKFAVKANDDDWVYRGVSSTKAWDSVWEAPIEIHLNQGENTIRLSGAVDVQGSWIILDYFDLILVNEEISTVDETTSKAVTTSELETETTQNVPVTTQPIVTTTRNDTPETTVHKTENETTGDSSVCETTTLFADKVTTNRNHQSIVKVGRGKIRSAKRISKTKAKIKIKRVKDAKGYQVKWGTNKKVAIQVKKINTRKLNVIIKKLKKGKKYYVKVRAYKISNGRKRYGEWSKKKEMKK